MHVCRKMPVFLPVSLSHTHTHTNVSPLLSKMQTECKENKASFPSQAELESREAHQPMADSWASFHPSALRDVSFCFGQRGSPCNPESSAGVGVWGRLGCLASYAGQSAGISLWS